MTNKIIIKVITALTLVFVFAFGFLSVSGYNAFNEKQTHVAADSVTTDTAFEIKTYNSKIINGVKLMSSDVAPLSDSSGTVTKTLTATVLPEDAPNKTVDWSCLWADDAPLKNENISNYITVTPTSDGATTATVTCKKSFRGSVAYVKVVTRVGGFFASCRVQYEGIPSSLVLDTGGLSKFDGVNGFQYQIPLTGAEIPITLDNVFHDVGENYMNNFTFTLSGVGKITVGNFFNGVLQGDLKEITLESIKNEILAVSISNGKLIVSPKKLVEGYFSNVTGNSQGQIVYNKFDSYVANSAGSPQVVPYFKIVVNCGNFFKDFLFRVVSSVTSVSLSDNTLTF